MSKIDEIHEKWFRHRSVLHELLELINDEHTNFKPWDNAF